MIETVGKKLQQARQRQQISVAEAARVTRMRPDKITDLENDNFTNFPNMTYAKGFLLIYAKFLHVDVSDFADTLESTNPVGIEDYEYLNASERRQPTAVYRGERRSLLPLIVAIVGLAVVVVVYFFVLTLKRIGGPDTDTTTKADALAPPAIVTLPSAAPAVSPAPTIEVRRAEAVNPAPSAPASSVPASPLVSTTPIPTATPAPVVKEVILKPIKKTWVKVVKDVADSPPVFEDWLFPDALPLKFHGFKFWIEAKDRTAVEITRDGQPVAADSPTVTIE